jgi:hypothetical protein
MTSRRVTTPKNQMNALDSLELGHIQVMPSAETVLKYRHLLHATSARHFCTPLLGTLRCLCYISAQFTATGSSQLR